MQHGFVNLGKLKNWLNSRFEANTVSDKSFKLKYGQTPRHTPNQTPHRRTQSALPEHHQRRRTSPRPRTSSGSSPAANPATKSLTSPPTPSPVSSTPSTVTITTVSKVYVTCEKPTAEHPHCLRMLNCCYSLRPSVMIISKPSSGAGQMFKLGWNPRLVNKCAINALTSSLMRLVLACKSRVHITPRAVMRLELILKNTLPNAILDHKTHLS